MNSIAKTTLCIAVAGAALFAVAASTARSGEISAVPTVSVHVGDLDARTVGGATHIYFRLQRAADKVCGEDADTRRQLHLVSVLRNCEQKAIEPAVERINAAPLTAIYIRHFPERRGTVEVDHESRG